MKKYLVGIDNGSTKIKATVFDTNGNELGSYSALADQFSPRPGCYERDMDEVWSSNCTAIKTAIERSGVGPEEIAGVAMTGHGNGVYPIAKDGRPAANAITGADSRAFDYVQKLTDLGYYEKIHNRTMQALWPALSLCVMAWIYDNDKETFDKIDTFFTVGDYVRFMMTGEKRAEISVNTGTGLFNTAEKKIDKEMLAEIGYGPLADKLPPLLGSSECGGYITAKASKECGLAEGTPVYGGCYDIDSAAIATGCIDETKMTVIVGSWANNQYIGPNPVVSKDFFSTTAFGRDGYYLMLEGSATSAANLEWFVGNFMDEEKKIAKANGTSVYDILEESVSSLEPEDSDIVFLPYLYGSNTNPKATGTFVGIQGWHERRHVIRAIYEGICFSHRYHIEKLLKFFPKPEAARMSGGGASSPVWSQMFADVLQMPMETSYVSELGTMGAAMFAGVGAGLFKDCDEAVEKMVRIKDRYEPNAEKKEIYDKKYQNWLNVIKALDQYF